MFRKKYVDIKREAIFLADINNNYVVVGVMPMTKDIVSFNNKSFIIDVKNATYVKNNVFYYVLIEKTGKQLVFEGSLGDPGITPEDIDLLFSSKILSEITEGLESSETKFEWSTFFMGAFLGIIVGASVMWMALQEQINALLNRPIGGLFP